MKFEHPEINEFFAELDRRIAGISEIKHPPDSRERMMAMRPHLVTLAKTDPDQFREIVDEYLDQYGSLQN